MNSFKQFLDKILSWLPLNGDKTKIGAIIAMVSQIHALSPGYDVLAWMDGRLLTVGVPMFLIGLIHKWVKAALLKADPALLSASSAKAMAKPDLSKSNLPLSLAPIRESAGKV